MVIDHDEDNLSDKETFSKNIPAIGKDILLLIYNMLPVRIGRH
jgi:hypothetical protein